MATIKSNIIPLRNKAPLDPEAKEAWAELLTERYGKGLRRYLMRLARNEEDAEDLVQESFYRVLQNKRLASVDNPGAFLFKTAHNLYIDRYRKQQLEQGFAERASGLTGSASDVQMHYSEMVLAYQHALAELPERCRQVFLLRRYDGLSNAEIAETLNITMRMVQKHLVKALEHFQQRLC